MKDRTPKYRGRVMLLPVAGQENIYDMTRADEPDDTGTPFNTRTMLQDSTAQFLKLPVSNPFVDDALRHMPDRINSVGTIRTTPQQSLGDAWLPCDGSQVTFAEYPELYQILRNISGAVSWENTVFATSADLFNKVTKPVFFKSKWYIFGSKSDLDGGSTSIWGTKEWQTTQILTVASADSLTGPWEIVRTVSEFSDWTSGNGTDISVAVSEDTLAVVWAYFYQNKSGGTQSSAVKIISTDDGTTWSDSGAINLNFSGAPNAKCLSTDGDTWAFLANDFIWKSSNPKTASSWAKNSPESSAASISFCNGAWYLAISSSSLIAVKASATLAGSFAQIGTIGAKYYKGLSQIVDYGGIGYFVVIDSDGTAANRIRLVAVDSGVTSVQETSDSTLSKTAAKSDIAASGNLIAVLVTDGSNSKVMTTSLPNSGLNSATLPTGSVPQNVIVSGNLAAATGSGSISYHDYTDDVRTLPTISLSSDTTTFIKAKKELDVFEAAQSGGD